MARDRLTGAKIREFDIVSTLAPGLALRRPTQHICRVTQHRGRGVEGLSQEGGPSMTDHGKDILAGLLFMGMIVGMLLGGWAMMHFLVS
jgi:hypothetical protein